MNELTMIFHPKDIQSDWSPIHDAAYNGHALSLQKLITQVQLHTGLLWTCYHTSACLYLYSVIRCPTLHCVINFQASYNMRGIYQ